MNLQWKILVTDFELTCLALIYKDLAARSKNTLSRDTFIQYFNIIVCTLEMIIVGIVGRTNIQQVFSQTRRLYELRRIYDWIGILSQMSSRKKN